MKYSYCSSNNITDEFYIKINPVDDKLPHLVINTIKLQEGSRKVLTRFDIYVNDQDTPDSLLIIDIIKEPMHGKIQKQEGDEYQSVRVSVL